jgi:flavodoxin I
MKTIIVYDSKFGNTEKIAGAIGEAMTGEIKVLRVGEADPSESFDLLIVGSPTHGGRPTPAIKDFIKQVPALNGAPVAAFDTRVTSVFAKLFGYAAGRIGKPFEKKGGKLVKPPQAFYVKGTEGPLKEGELERAARWAEELAKSIQ